MKIEHTGTTRARKICRLEPGDLLRFPRGEGIYIVAFSSRRYEGKIRIVKLDTGRVIYEDPNKPVVKVDGELTVWDVTV